MMLPRAATQRPGPAGRTALLIAAVAATLCAVLVIAAIREVEARSRAVAHTLVVQQAVAAVREVALDAETGQRGFLVTGDERYLEPYARAASRERRVVAHLRELAQDDTAQAARVNALDSLLALRLRIAAAPIAARRAAGPEAAARQLAMGGGKATMDHLRALTDSILERETQLLRRRERGLQRAISRLWGLGLLLATVAGGAIAVALRQRRRSREERTAAMRDRLLAQMVDSAGAMICVRERVGGRVLAMNRAFREAAGPGPDATAPERFAAGIHPDDQPAIEAHRARLRGAAVIGLPHDLTFRHRSPDGRWRQLALRDVATSRLPDGAPGMLVATITDVTELRDRESRVQQLQKMEALGQMAGGIAHDFNNLVTVISGNVELALMNADVNGPGPELEEIRDTARRLAELTRQLLALSRHEEGLPAAEISLNAVVDRARRLLEHAVRGQARVQVRLDQTVGTVLGEALPLEQGLLNLVLNARDALDGRTDGCVVVRTVAATLTEPLAHTFGEVPPGDYGVLVVEDNGPGIADAVLPRILDPFFTTKPMGKGTGLGLAMLAGAVRRMGGHLMVETDLGRGTVFRIYLQHVGRSTGDRRQGPSADLTGAGAPGALIADDDPAVRDFLARALQSRGYRTWCAATTSEALQIWRALEAETPQLVITELRAQNLDGLMLREHLAAMGSAACVVLMSARHERPALAAEDAAVVLNKPFTVQELYDRLPAVVERLRVAGASA